MRQGLLVLAVLCACCRALSAPPPLLLVVGDVRSSAARVLWDPRGAALASLSVRVLVREPRRSPSSPPVYAAERELALALSSQETDRAQVLVLENLSPNRHYTVIFDASGREETVRFRTPGGDDSLATRVLVTSCDRFVDDQDDELWVAMGDDIDSHGDEFFGVAHIGDQVYVDAGNARIPIQPVGEKIRDDKAQLRAHYESIVAQFRSIYRETLGRPAAQRVLRQGAHWMIPDDHEVINNFNSYFVDRAFEEKAPSEMELSKQLGLQLHYRVGFQVLYEYQYQLRGDVMWDSVDFFTDSLASILARYPLYFAVDVDRLKLFFLDVRFDRSLTLPPSERHRLISDMQLNELKQKLTAWNGSTDNSIVVLSSMPLFFHSSLTAKIVYAIEKELYPGHPDHLAGLTDLFSIFSEFVAPPKPTLKLLVGGDVHTLAHTSVCGSPANTTNLRCIDQLITSGLTNGSTAVNDAKLVPFYFLILRLYPVWTWLTSILGIASSPWTLSASRVFLGRNYGVLEMDSNGIFEWKNSVVLLHETPRARLAQWIFDLLTPSVLVASVTALWFIFRCCKSKRSSPHVKTD